MMETLWIHGGVAMVAGIVILFFPKIFLFLAGALSLVMTLGH